MYITIGGKFMNFLKEQYKPYEDFLNIASACPITNVMDIEFNLTNIKECINDAINKKVKYIIFPELSITSYSCGDLFFNGQLLNYSLKAIEELCLFLKDKDILVSIGAPLLHKNSLYNCAFIIHYGKILGIVPKSNVCSSEQRWFSSGFKIKNEYVTTYFQENIPFGIDLIFESGKFKFSFVLGDDFNNPISLSNYLCIQGANIIGNLSASNELVGKSEKRRHFIKTYTKKLSCGYIYSSCGVYESTTDLVYSGHLLIGESGSLLKENKRFKRENEIIISSIDVDKLILNRIKNTNLNEYSNLCPFDSRTINFSFKNLQEFHLQRTIKKYPFLPYNEKYNRLEEIFNIQVSALAKRLEHTNLKSAVIGISGGLDSTLALLVTVKTFELLNLDLKNIIAITMPGFGTTDRTYNNAISLCKKLKISLREINIVKSCLQHFEDIAHDPNIHDVTYENVQARERTQILMDIANKEGGLVVGTGDLSEMALGWCTFNGDHMSMYGVNASVPKTLVRYLVKHVALEQKDKEISSILLDILDTPVSPELLPKDAKGNICQKTENIVGPYELHDFFLYYFIKGFDVKKIYYLACEAFREDYKKDIIEKWLKFFIKRFFTQQFKRSTVPDGPKVGSISLSPRGDFVMPSDGSYNSFL